MQLRLWPRLFIAFATLSISALFAFGFLQQNNFQRGFLDYLNRLGLERLEQPARQLGLQYAEHGNWRFAEGDRRRLMSVLGLAAAGDETDFGPPPRAEGRGFPPPREGRDPDFRPPPPRDRDSGFNDGQERRRPRPDRNGDFAIPGIQDRPPQDHRAEFAAQQEQRRPPRQPAGPLDLARRLLLLDSDGNIVNGNPEVPRESPSITIQSEGKVVGKLLLQPLPGLRGGIDVAFANSQIKHAGIAALFVLIGALLAAWALSRWLLSPIRALGRGAGQLAAGEYSTRLKVERSDELGELAVDFNHMASTLEAHRKSREQWGADIAHELRTPLSILRGEIQALQDGIRQVNPETLASLQNECGRMESLVEDLYQLALSDAGALSYRFEPLDLAAILRDIVAAQKELMKNAGLDLQIHLPSEQRIIVRADRQRLAQLFGNLLSNSLRYTDAPGQVMIEVTRANNFWEISVEDSAPGVSGKDLERIFDRLYRAEPSRSRAFGGAGLGLSICRNIVAAHDGSIRAKTSVQGGLLIQVQLPVHEA